MELRGILHGDFLVMMKAIPESFHKMLVGLFKSGKKYPRDWTALGVWLEIYWIERLEQLVLMLKQGHSRQQPLPNKFIQTSKMETKLNDGDKWDKEYIAELQGTNVNP